MRPPLDLHIHSIYSDGTFSPTDICRLAVKKGLQTIALSDHDTTDGLPVMQEAVNQQNAAGNNLTLIPSIEVSSGGNGMLHILGYGITPNQEPMQSELAALRRKRVARSAETIRRLNHLLGTHLTQDEMMQDGNPKPVLSRMHVARLLITKHYVKTVEEAFRKYLSVGMPAYVPLQHISAEKAIGSLTESKAVPVLAHPMRVTRDRAELEKMICHLRAYGLRGLEVFHPSASRPDVKWLYNIAQKYNLLVTGGSDFHGEYGMHAKLGGYPSGWQTWKQDIDILSMAVKQAALLQVKEISDV